MNWIKANIKWVIVCIIVIIGVPITLIFLYWFGSSVGGVTTPFSPNDLLAHIGTSIIFSATIYLGYVANKQNQRLIQLAERDRLPIIDIVPIDGHDVGSSFVHIIIDEDPKNENTNNSHYFFGCTNISKQYICDIQLGGYQIQIGKKTFAKEGIQTQHSINSLLKPNESKGLELILLIDHEGIPNNFELEFILTVVGSKQFKEHIKFDFVGTSVANFILNKRISIIP